jgi:hypothetical protein
VSVWPESAPGWPSILTELVPAMVSVPLLATELPPALATTP